MTLSERIRSHRVYNEPPVDHWAKLAEDLERGLVVVSLVYEMREHALRGRIEELTTANASEFHRGVKRAAEVLHVDAPATLPAATATFDGWKVGDACELKIWGDWTACTIVALGEWEEGREVAQVRRNCDGYILHPYVDSIARSGEHLCARPIPPSEPTIGGQSGAAEPPRCVCCKKPNPDWFACVACRSAPDYEGDCAINDQDAPTLAQVAARQARVNLGLPDADEPCTECQEVTCECAAISAEMEPGWPAVEPRRERDEVTARAERAERTLQRVREMLLERHDIGVNRVAMSVLAILDEESER